MTFLKKKVPFVCIVCIVGIIICTVSLPVQSSSVNAQTRKDYLSFLSRKAVLTPDSSSSHIAVSNSGPVISHQARVIKEIPNSFLQYVIILNLQGILFIFSSLRINFN